MYIKLKSCLSVLGIEVCGLHGPVLSYEMYIDVASYSLKFLHVPVL